MRREEEIRERVKILRRFYLDVMYFSVVNFVLIMIWLTFDRTGTFWPKYVLVVWGIFLILRAYKTGVLPLIFHRSSFLSQEWEDKKVREIMRKRPPYPPVAVKKDKKKK